MHDNKKEQLRKTVRSYIRNGVYDQHKIFNSIYPTYFGHYSTLRDIISEEKNR